MPYESRAKIEMERDELRDALEGILDRVTDALGVETEEPEPDEDDDEDEDEAEEEVQRPRARRGR